MSVASSTSISGVRFNVTPIKTVHSEPSDALSNLKSKVVVIHGEKDYLDETVHVTKLAIADDWASPDMLSYYDDGERHLVIVDKPTALAKTYRQAFEEQVLN